jgi:hypothetical protein
MALNTIKPGLTLSGETGAAIEANRFLKLDTGKYVHAGAGEQVIGISNDKLNNGDDVAVIVSGVVEVVAGANGVTAGKEVVSVADGKAEDATDLAVASGAETATAVDATTPTLAGSALPQKIRGIALTTATEDEKALILLK